MGKKITNEEFLKRIKDKNIKYVPLEEYQGKDTKIKWLCYKDKKHIFEATPHNILNGSNCPYCSNKKVLIGYNDLSTTHPEVANMLIDKSIGYKYSYGSNYKTDWICPNCGNKINKRSIYYVVTNGLQCANCISHISYPERLMATFLSQLKIPYIHDKATSWSNRRRYDFNIKSYKAIIECHGMQHYVNKGWDKKCDLSKQMEIDRNKMDIALANGVKYYIQLDCSVSDFDYIKNSILNSELNNLFNLENFDWDLCRLSVKAIDNGYYNNILNAINNDKKTVSEISDTTGISLSTVRKYLYRITDNGLFNYTHENAKQYNKMIVSKKVICIETKKVYSSMTKASNDTNCTVKGISDCCRNVVKTHKKLHWMYYDEYIKDLKE